MNKKNLCVLLGTTGKPPYEETAPADVLETFNSAVLGRLLTRNASFDLEPGLIKTWLWDYQKNIYELTLRNDIYFHNGRHATTKDLEFSLLRGFFTKYRSFYKMFLSNIEGIEETSKYNKFKSGVVSGVKITGPYTLQIKLKTPNPTFLYNLAVAYFSLVAKEALSEDYIRWNNLPVGAGPYKIIAQDLNIGKFVLEKANNNEKFIPKKIEIYTKPSKVEYDIVAFTDPPSNQAIYQMENPRYPDRVWSVFFLNLNPLGNNPIFHKAMHFGVHREKLLEGIQSHHPTYEMLPAHFWGREAITNSFDFKKAKQLFASLPKRLTDRTWPVPVFGGKNFSRDKQILLERLKKQFAEFGFKVNFYPSIEKFISKTKAIECPIQIAGNIVDYIDPVIMFSAYRKDSPFEYERPAKPDLKFEKLFALANTATTTAERQKTVRALSIYFNESSMAIPLWESKISYYVNPKTIQTMGDQVEPLYLLLDRVVMK